MDFSWDNPPHQYIHMFLSNKQIRISKLNLYLIDTHYLYKFVLKTELF